MTGKVQLVDIIGVPGYQEIYPLEAVPAHNSPTFVVCITVFIWNSKPKTNNAKIDQGLDEKVNGEVT